MGKGERWAGGRQPKKIDDCALCSKGRDAHHHTYIACSTIRLPCPSVTTACCAACAPAPCMRRALGGWKRSLFARGLSLPAPLNSAAQSSPRAPRCVSVRAASFGATRSGGAGGKKQPKTVFLCSECGDHFPQSHGRCPSCQVWGRHVPSTGWGFGPERSTHNALLAPSLSLKPFTPPDASSATGGGGGAAARVLARVPLSAPSQSATADASSPSSPRVRSGWVTASSAAQSLSSVLASGAASPGWRLVLRGELGAEVSRVLGGGVVPGSLTLVGGDPGVGKSTLLLQMASLLADAEPVSGGPPLPQGPVLYVSGEESVQQVAARAQRLNLPPDSLHLLAATRVEAILQAMAELSPRAVVVDSIQTVYLDEATGSAGSVSQVRECATALLHAAKSGGAPVFLVGHVTKSGDIAGPRTLEHIVDVVLYLEGEALREFRLLRGVKNRYGAADEIGVFEMVAAGMRAVPNPSAAFLASRVVADGVASAVSVTLEGSRPLLLEIQALCAPQPSRGDDAADGKQAYVMPARRSAVGVLPQRLNLLLAVLSKRVLGPGLYANDVFVNVVGGLQLDDPATDLALCAAISAAFHDTSLPADMAFVGEVGLGGELRAVPQTERRVAEAARLGFLQVCVPAAGFSESKVARTDKCRVVPCANVADVMKVALGEAVMGKAAAARGGSTRRLKKDAAE